MEIMRKFSEQYARKSGTYFCVDKGVTSVVIKVYIAAGFNSQCVMIDVEYVFVSKVYLTFCVSICILYISFESRGSGMYGVVKSAGCYSRTYVL